MRGETRLTFNYARALTRKIASYVYSGPVRFSALPNGAETGASGIYTHQITEPTREDYFVLRLDHHFSGRDSISARLSKSLPP